MCITSSKLGITPSASGQILEQNPSFFPAPLGDDHLTVELTIEKKNGGFFKGSITPKPEFLEQPLENSLPKPTILLADIIEVLVEPTRLKKMIVKLDEIPLF